MTLLDTIQQLDANLRAGRFTNEAEVSTGVVLRILQGLDWPVFDTSVVAQQFPLKIPNGGTRREDIALCREDGRPLVFIEVKAVGKIVGADLQLFEYCFHGGVPFAVLTDGQEWHFYLPMEPGNYDDRSVYKLDILEQDHNECCSRFRRYLSIESVRQGSNLEYARSDRNIADRLVTIQTTLPRAWETILTGMDDSISEILADKVEDLCGFRPDMDTCADFLRNAIHQLSPSSAPIPRPTALPPKPSSPPSGTSEELHFTGFVFQDERRTFSTARATMLAVFDKLAEYDATFLDRFASRKHGRKRRYLAQDKYELYPDRPDLCEQSSSELAVGGWFISTNWGKQAWEGIARLACEVAGLTFGSDIVISFG